MLIESINCTDYKDVCAIYKKQNISYIQILKIIKNLIIILKRNNFLKITLIFDKNIKKNFYYFVYE